MFYCCVGRSQDAADGAVRGCVNRWCFWLRRFFSVIVPIMKPIFVVVLIMRTMDAFMMFDLVLFLTNGGPQGATETVSTFAVQTAFQYFEINTQVHYHLLYSL